MDPKHKDFWKREGLYGDEELTYASDYSPHFTSRSIPDKDMIEQCEEHLKDLATNLNNVNWLQKYGHNHALME